MGLKNKVMSLKHKMIKGGSYLVAVNIFSQFLSIGVNIVLAGLLLPSDFGLVALSGTYIGLITVFTNIGFGSSIIHNQDSTHRQISTIYWINFLLSIFTFLVVCLTAPYAALFYSEARLTPVVWISAINILLTPFFIIHYKIKERDLEFGILSRITVISTTIGAISGMIGAFAGLGVYALVLQSLISTFARLSLILGATKWKPLWVFEYKSVKQMVWYSVKFKIAGSLLYFERNIDYLILGKVFTSTTLGFYAFAYNIMYTPVKRISYIFSNVLFPSFSSIKKNPEKIISGYFKSIQLIAMVSFPAMTLLAFNAEPVIQFMFGDKWNDAIPIVEILCFAGAVQSISQLGDVIFSSIGKPQLNIYFGLVRTGFTAGAIIFGSFYGVLVVAWLLLLSKLISYMILLKIIQFHIRFSVFDFFRYLKGPIITVITLSIIQLGFLFSEFSPGFFKFFAMFLAAMMTTGIFHYSTIKELSHIISNSRLKTN